MIKPFTDDTYSDEETARRRDAIIKRMIATPPQPHKPKSKTVRTSRTPRAKAKRRGPSA